jgi:thiamine-phosphate pyrophosphorylase
MKRYYITDRKAVGGFRPLLEVIRDQMHLGVDFIQIREKDLAARELYNLTMAVLEARAQELNVHAHPKILINTRADIAKATGADGVHLPAVAPLQTLPGLLVVRSCHTIEEVRSAQAEIVTFGPVFPSPGKGAAIGLETLAQACRSANGKRVFALGGITWDNAASCMEAGAAGIAGIRLFQQPDLD